MVVALYKMCGKSDELQRLNMTTIIFKKLNGSYGECHQYSNSVRINQDVWFFLSPIEKLELTLHEVGHCVLLMEHRDNSIMQTSGFLSGNLYVNFEHYMNEYFQCDKCCNIPKDFL